MSAGNIQMWTTLVYKSVKLEPNEWNVKLMLCKGYNCYTDNVLLRKQMTQQK